MSELLNFRPGSASAGRCVGERPADGTPRVRPSRPDAQRRLPDNFISMDGGSGDSSSLEITSRLEAARLDFDAQARRFEAAKSRLQATLDQIQKGRSRREILHNSAFARLQARLETMPVIEQAKGILMAQHRCGPEEAFDLLRRASQSANVRVSVLATQIVDEISSHEPRPRGGPPRSASRS